jgi:hypothetical protein
MTDITSNRDCSLESSLILTDGLVLKIADYFYGVIGSTERVSFNPF